MHWDLILNLYEIIGLVVVIGTSLVIGLSLVEVNLISNLKQIVFISIVYGILVHLLGFVISYNILFIITYLTLIPVIIFILKTSFYQGLIAVLLALIYDLAIIKLLTYNLFDIALMKTNITSDPLIQIALSSFIMLTNIFVALTIYRSNPVLFPKRWLETQHGDVETSGHKFHVVFIMLILLLLNTFLFYTYTELLYFRLSYRVFVMFWSLLTCILMVYFSRNIVIHSIERVQLTIDRAYQKDVLKFYNMIRSQRHDFNIHLNGIYGLIKSQNYIEANTYIEEIVGEAKEVNDLLPLYHPATAAMLSTLKLDALQKGVKLIFNLQDNLREMPCTIYETNKILGNLIYNAIEEVEKQEDTADSPIIIEITKEFHSIILKVSNKTTTTEQELQHIFDIGYSTKSSHEGIGLPAIMNIISNYNGVLYPEIEENLITMNVRIPLSSS